jgi:hypothetical protein
VSGPEDAVGTLRVAEALFASGEKAKAKAVAEKAVGLADPKNPGLRQYVEEQAKKFGADLPGEKKEK